MEGGWPNPSYDLLGLLDFVFPKGIDALRGFRRPTWATPLYQRVVRRLAGYGRFPTPATADAFPPGSVVECDLAIVGAGAAGRDLARALEGEPGLRYLINRGSIPNPPDSVTTLPSTTVVFLPPPRRERSRPFTMVAIDRDRKAIRIEATRVVVAVGGYDANLLFEGNDRPGVVTADGVSNLHPDPQSAPFRRAVLVGGGRRAAQMLERYGDQISAVVAPGEIEPDVVRAGSDRGIPLFPRTMVLGTTGRRRIRRLSLKSRAPVSPLPSPVTR